MPNIPQEAIIAIVAPLAAWLILKSVAVSQSIWNSYCNNKSSSPDSYFLKEVFRLGWDAGEQLIEKHGITDRAEIERRVLQFVNQYMIAAGYEPPTREMAEMLIKAIGREYNKEKG